MRAYQMKTTIMTNIRFIFVSNNIKNNNYPKVQILKSAIIFLVSITFCLLPSLVVSQEIDTPLGKNRVQYTDDFDSWSKYETENFVTFWYGKSRNVAITAMQLAEYDFDEIQNMLEHRINEKIELVVYGDIGELYQTNIGLQGDDPQNVESIQLIGTKLFVHFDGNHNHLRENIREGIAKVYIFSMLFGNSFQEVVSSSFMAEMPEWFKNGIILYAKNSWTIEDDTHLRYLLNEKRRPYRNYNKLTRREPDIAGKAFWYYLGETYGISSISNVIYLTRINRSVRSAFQYVLGETYEDVLDDCYAYYQERYKEDKGKFEFPKRKDAVSKNSNFATFDNITLSPDGKKFAYSRNKNGRLVFYVQDVKSNKRKRLYSMGYNNPYRETDENYPVFFWTSDSKQLGYIYEKRNILQLRIRNMETNEVDKNTMNPIFNRVYSASFIDDENLVLSANTDGFSDLYRYNLNTRIQRNLTVDYHDDLDAKYAVINDIPGVLFSSNRDKSDVIPVELDTLLTIGQFDLYFLALEENGKLFRLNNSEQADEFKAEYNNGAISYNTNKYGVQTTVSQKLSKTFKLSGEPKIIQLGSQIIDQSCKESWCVYSTHYNKRDMIFIDSFQLAKPAFTKYQEIYLQKQSNSLILLNNIEEEKVDVRDTENIPEGWFFDTRFPDPPVKEKANSTSEPSLITGSKANKAIKYDPLRTTTSRLRFKIQNMSSNLDNQPLFTGMNSYAADRVGYQAAPLGLLMKMQVGDSFEDYVFEGGVRLATNFSGYEAFLTFEDRKRQWDHFYAAYYRSRSNRRIDQFDLLERNRENTFLLYYQIKYPFDEFQSIRLSGTLRSDQNFTLITDDDSFVKPVTNTQRLGIRAEYVYDNSSQRSMNIYNGSRTKFFVEAMNRFRVQFADPFTIEPNNGFLSVLGVDSRYYLPIFDKSVLAARLSAGTSLGSERILYYVGGVERALISGFDQSTGIPNENFAFENIAPQLRGFDRNIRNGTSYVVSTVELRVPIFRHIFSDQIRYDFLREFQVVGFFDSGTAWHGLSPYSPENPINSAQFESGESVIINVQYFRDPLVLGYGFGFRSSVFGYFVKMDFARGIETRATLPLRVHLSLGTDF